MKNAIYIKCFDAKKDWMFFVISNLSEQDHSDLVYHLVDLGIKMKASSAEDLQNTNPFLQPNYCICYLDKNCFVPHEVSNFIAMGNPFAEKGGERVLRSNTIEGD